MWGVLVRDCQGSACVSCDLSPELWSWRLASGMWCSARASTPGTSAEWRRWRCPNMRLRKARCHTTTMSSTSGLNLTAQKPSSRMGTGKNAVFTYPGQLEFLIVHSKGSGVDVIINCTIWPEVCGHLTITDNGPVHKTSFINSTHLCVLYRALSLTQPHWIALR